MMGNEGRYAESVEVARQALTVQQAYLPADHPDALTTEQTYAMALLNAHDPAHAEAILRDIAARSSRVRGPTHSDTLIAQAQLGEVLIDLGRFAEAEAILHPAAQALDRVQGSDSRYATGTWSDYVVAACSADDAAAGLEVARRIDDIRAQTLPPNDWHRAATKTDIGLCLVHLHRYAEAEPILLNAAASLEAARGSGFYTTQLTYKVLRDLYRGTGREADAARMASKLTP
jgi:serine/threonine-protein kinase